MKSILKNTKVKENDLTKEVSSNNMKIYLHLALELLPERLYIEGYRIVLGKFIKAARTIDSIGVIAQ